MSLFASLTGSSYKPFWKPPKSQHDGFGSASSIQLSPDENKTIEASRSRRHQGGEEDELGELARRVHALTRQTQYLLDAQAAGLAAGRDNGQDSESQSERSVSESRVTPVRQPQDKPISLNAARKGIQRTMRDLANAKIRETELLSEKAQESQSMLKTIQAWETRRGALESDRAAVQDQSNTKKMQDLTEERASLRDQIDLVERQLLELKSQHRAVEAELLSLENSMQSKMSSYDASLALIDKEIKQTLNRPPMLLQATGSTSLADLPENRRTLDMLKDSMQDQDAEIKRRQDLAATESKALDDGMELWKVVMSKVFSLESTLRFHLRQTPTASLDSLEDEFRSALRSLEKAYATAQGKNWNLLVCCIGAELEALRKGRDMLFGSQSGLSTPTEASTVREEATSQATLNPFERPNSAHDSDGPDPDLLVSTDADE